MAFNLIRAGVVEIAVVDCHHLTQPSPERPAEPERVGYINAHGTATQWNDKNETDVIKQVFGKSVYSTLIVGNMGALGHAIAAGGARSS